MNEEELLSGVLDRTDITGGPFKDTSYVLEKAELHWGENDNNGSEHLVNSRPYAAEVGIVVVGV